LLESAPDFREIPRISPNKRLPIIFTVKVPNGISSADLFKPLEITKRNALPKPPPRKTINIAFI
jgi:hypothetical protein